MGNDSDSTNLDWLNHGAAEASACAECLRGIAAGDAIGLPYEGLSAGRAYAMARLDRARLAHRLFFGRGLASDDTDHAVFVFQSIASSGGDISAFDRSMRWRLRWWFASLPSGIGYATLRACLKMWLFLKNTSVNSAGNGAAMRAPALGALLCNRPDLIIPWVDASSMLTHRDPRALDSARAVALLCAAGARGEFAQGAPRPSHIFELAASSSESKDWKSAMAKVQNLLEARADWDEARADLGRPGRVEGFCMESVPFAIWAWARSWGDYRGLMEGIVGSGGDVDTHAAIAGGLAGASWGAGCVPSDWLDGIVDYPHNPALIERFALMLRERKTHGLLWFSPLLFLRSPFFMALVLFHGFRRLLPPYRRNLAREKPGA